jgi:lipopolysaccharide/colanic/teichoic acid biosynthesis glycosyltransferase
MTRDEEEFVTMSSLSGMSRSAIGLLAAGIPPWKLAMDWVLAVVLLVLTAPVMMVAMALVYLTSRGGALYTQTRLGLHGRPFVIYKIRTMYRDSERETGPCWSLPGDPRITRIGWILRLTHIDELPQLWNILRGEMSLVGPRPERPEIVKVLEKQLPCYRNRLLVRPGVTGLSQVQLPPDTDLESVRCKLASDLYYIKHFSLWLDLRIMIGTAMGASGLPFSVARELLRIPSIEVVRKAYDSGSGEMEVLPDPIEPVVQVTSA